MAKQGGWGGDGRGGGGVCTVSFNSNVYIYLKYSSFSGWIFI